MVTALARFFRISLSRGKSLITVKDELEHVRNYLMIQQMRFKNKFTYTIESDDEVLELASLKLMLQPLVENTIYHGMEYMDGDGGSSCAPGRRKKSCIWRCGTMGSATEEQVESLFTDTAHVASSADPASGYAMSTSGSSCISARNTVFRSSQSRMREPR